MMAALVFAHVRIRKPTQILARLIEAPGPVSKWDLVDEVAPGSANDGIVRVYIHLIRQTFGRDAIRNTYGGYELTEKGRAACMIGGTD